MTWQGDRDRSERRRSCAARGDRGGPEQPAKARLAGAIILATAEGCGTAAAMRRAGVSKPSVWRWQERFMAEGVDGLLHDKTRPSRIPPLPKAVIEAVVTRTLEEAPPQGVTHWTAPAMAAASGLSVSSVQRAALRGDHRRSPWEPAAGGRTGCAPIRFDVQALERSQLRHQGRGHRRAVCRSAGPRRGALDRREASLAPGPTSVVGPERERFRRSTAPSRVCP